MPAYKFEIIHGDNAEAFDVECDGLDGIRAEAVTRAGDFVGNLPGDFWERPRWALRVTDEGNMTILSLTFFAD
jgi:hypothetical protein